MGETWLEKFGNGAGLGWLCGHCWCFCLIKKKLDFFGERGGWGGSIIIGRACGMGRKRALSLAGR